MFVKISVFHFSSLLGPVLEIIGMALWLAAGSLYAYFRFPRRSMEAGAPEPGLFRRFLIFGVFLIAAGIAAQAFFARPSVLDEKYEFRAPAKNDVGKIFYQPVDEPVSIPLKEMTRKIYYKLLKDPERIQMHRNGYIETPFLFFGPGKYVLEFNASGTVEKNGRSRILAGFLTIGSGGTVLSGDPVVYELTPEMKKYSLILPDPAGRLGAVRIEFLNSPTLTKGLIRMVTISDVVLRRLEIP